MASLRSLPAFVVLTRNDLIAQIYYEDLLFFKRNKVILLRFAQTCEL